MVGKPKGNENLSVMKFVRIPPSMDVDLKTESVRRTKANGGVQKVTESDLIRMGASLLLYGKKGKPTK
jgi:hypothetical protein